MSHIIFPNVVAHRKTTPQRSMKRPYFFIAFVVLLLFVAGMSFYSSMHIHSESLGDVQSKTMSSILERSENRLIDSAGKVFGATSNYFNQNFLTNPTSQTVVQHKNIDLPSRKRLAYAITITKDGPFQDGAAVLAYSIMKYATNTSYDISLIAFVHPNVTASRPGLTKLGFHVIEVPTPVNTSAIRFAFLRDHIDKNGCCGAAELIKVTSYRLLQYHRVIHLDADTMFLNSVDELYSRDYSLIYTTDPNMASHKGEDKMPVQGGFIVMQPSEEVYQSLINIVMNTEFAKGGAWNRSKIGWFWGGMTVQGVLPYYYNRVAVPGRSQIVDRCYYNTMADTEPCSVQTLDQLKSAHFTVCQKPWGCMKGYVNRLCADLHHRWYDLRKEAEEFYGIPVNQHPCPKGGPKNYQPMRLDMAVMPYDKLPFVVRDDSLDRYIPIADAKYTGGRYN